MRPLRLTIEGLTAFRERQDIDFADLDVFAITGPTGAGKTSIFDAMSLALFGRIPRVGTSTQVRRFISHGSSEAVVSLDFSVGGARYRVRRRYRSASSVSDVTLELIDPDGESSDLENGQRAVTARVTELVGMDYDAFQRAVLLPQGQFDLFLTGDPGERRRVLIRLLDLERYVEAGRRAREEARASTAAIEARGARLVALEHATEATRARCRLERDAAVSRRDALGASVRSARASATRRERAAALARQLGVDASAWRELSERAARLGDDAREADDLMRSARQAESSTRTRLADAEAALAERERARADTSARVGTAEEHAQAASAIETCDASRARVAARAGELERARTAEAVATAALSSAAGALGRALGVIEEAIRIAHVAGEHASAALSTARAGRVDAERAYERLVRRHLAAGIRPEVHVGEDCPVCDRPIEERPTVDSAAGDDLASGKSELETARAGESDAAAVRAAAEREIDRLEAERDRIVADFGTVLELAPDSTRGDAEPTGEPAPRTANEASERSLEACRRAVEATRAASDGLARASATRVAIERSSADADAELAAAERRVRALLGGGFPGEPRVELDRRREALRQAEDARESANAELVAARERHQRARDAVAAHADADSGRQRRLSEIRGRADVLLLRSEREEAWPDLRPPAWPDGLDQLDRQLAAHLGELAEMLERAEGAAIEEMHDATERIARLASEVGDPAGRRIDPADALVVAHEAAIAAASEAEHRLAILDGEITERAEIERWRSAARRRVDRLEWLASHLRDDSSGFLAYVIAESLDTLCELASSRLEQMSERRYALHADTDGSFQVVDYANAGERRDVETLSGGESFLVSFSLALALAEAITNYGEAHGATLEAIFIDEGFSALDSDSLEVALDALEVMGRAEQRMIGLISHVERVPERIPDGLDVVKAEGGSRVRRRQGGHRAPAQFR